MAYNSTTTNLDVLLDVDHLPELQPAPAPVVSAGGGGVAALLSPIMAGPPQSRSSPAKNAVSVNPLQFTKALAVGDTRMKQKAELARERRANLIYGTGIFVAMALLLTVVGATVFGDHGNDDAQHTIIIARSPAGNYTGSLDDTDVDGDRGQLREMPGNVVGERLTSIASIDNGDDAEVLSTSDNFEYVETVATLSHAPRERSWYY